MSFVTEGEAQSPEFKNIKVDQSTGDVETTLSSISISITVTPGVILLQSNCIFSGVILMILVILHSGTTKVIEAEFEVMLDVLTTDQEPP